MLAQTLERLDQKEVFRYLGYRGRPADERTIALVESCSKQLLTNIRPRYLVKRCACTITDTVVIEGTTLRLEGQSIQKHLQGCHDVLLFCATLSQKADILIRQSQIIDVARGLVMDCCATAAIEQVCDTICERLGREYAAKGEYLTSRFSPGYGDLPITIQKEFLQVMDAPRQIGLCANESNLLIPRKSVTAVIGIRTEKRLQKKSCLTCAQKETCPYRRWEENNENDCMGGK